MKRLLLPLLISLTFLSCNNEEEELAVNPTSINVEHSAGSGSFVITSNLEWTIDVSDSWLSVNPTQGSNDADIALSWSGNPEYESRNATIKVVGSGTELITINVYQEAKTLIQFEWEFKSEMPTARSYSAPHAIVYENKFYVIGGANADFEPLDNVEVYDPGSDSWTPVKPMLKARWGHTAEIVGEKIYVMGGCPTKLGDATSDMEVYDPATDTWEHAGAMPLARLGAASCTVEGKIYVLGGRTAEPGGDYYASMDRYDPSTNKWVTLSPMPTPNAYFAASVANGIIYAIGGVNIGGAGSAVNSIYKYDIASDTWSKGAELKTERWSPIACAVDSLIVCAGGYTGPTDAGQRSVEIIQTTSGRVSQSTSMLKGVAAFSICQLSGRIYVFGGTTTSPPDYGASQKVQVGSFVLLK
jgi:N-acetylneuraminic acid mutarotase